MNTKIENLINEQNYEKALCEIDRYECETSDDPDISTYKFCVTMDWGKRRYVWIMRKKLSRINHMKQMYIIIVDMHMKQMVIYLMHMNNI